jgi:hypothetical protein
MHRLSDAEDYKHRRCRVSKAILAPGPSSASPNPSVDRTVSEAARPRTSPDRITELRKWPARHSERVLPRPALDLKMLTERADEPQRFHRYWEAWGALLATRGHRLTLRSTVALSHLHRGAAPPAARGHLTVIVARDRRQPPLAAATSPGTSRPHLRRTLLRHRRNRDHRHPSHLR